MSRKKILFALVLVGVMVMLLGLTGSAAAEDPPWEATQGRGSCFSTWITPEFQFIHVYGEGHGVIQYKNGIWSLTCNQYYDFDSGQLATLEQVCSLVPEFCNGNGTFIRDGFRCFMEVPGDPEPHITYDSFQVVNKAGQGTFTCHYNPSSQ